MRSPLARINRTTWFNLGIALRSAAHQLGTGLLSPQAKQTGPIDIFLCLVDHYEPQVGRPTGTLARERVEDWLHRYPRIAGLHRDADGCLPKHSFFYPWDEYDAWELDRIAELCASGYGEVEIHLHHRDDTEETLRQKFRDAIRTYRSHGVLSCWPDGRPAWGFIHGNWALANSRFESGRNFCGVNNEIAVLQEEGCYADFTFPAWQHIAQPSQLNSIYYAQSDAARPKSYNTGQVARTGVTQQPGLLLVQGPLVPYMAHHGRSLRVAIDDSDIAAYRRYHPSRMDRWVRAGIHVQGCKNRIFIKLHSHGADDRNRESMLGEDLEALFADAEARYNDGKRYRLHYVTAREMFNIVKATEAGIEDLQAARDWLIPAPDNAHRNVNLESAEDGIRLAPPSKTQ